MKIHLYGLVVVVAVLLGVVSWAWVLFRGRGARRGVRACAAVMLGVTLLHLCYVASGSFFPPDLATQLQDVLFPLNLLLSAAAAWPLLVGLREGAPPV